MKAKPRITIATFNLELCKDIEGLSSTIFELVNKGVSIFCFQEVKISKSIFKEIFFTNLQEKWEVETFYEHTQQNQHCVAIAWKKNELYMSSITKTVLPLAQFNFFEKAINYLLGFSISPIIRGALTLSFQFQKTSLRVTSVHLDFWGGSKHKLNQLQFLVKKLSSLKSVSNEILCGDFNSFYLFKPNTIREFPIRYLEKNGYKEASKNILWTLNALNSSFGYEQSLLSNLPFTLRRKVDFIWIKASSNMCTETISSDASDHLAVLSELLLS